MQSNAVLLVLLLSVIGVVYASELNDVFRSNSNGQSQSSQQAQTQPESAELITAADIGKWKRGINLGRKMCQIDHRNCRSFNEAKRFYPQPSKVNYNLLADLLKNNLQNAELMAPYVDDK